MAGDRLKNLVSKFTTNRFAGVVTGTVATTLLESSSVTIIMTIAMVNAGLLTFAQSLGVVLGSNIGTTIGAQLISLNINLYAPIAMLIGAVLQFAGRTDNQKSLGLILLGIGLLFFGLDVIDEAMKLFRDYQPFINLMATLGKNPVLGAAIGALFTVLIQSSSATVAIVITLASSGLISLPAGIALMLGQSPWVSSALDGVNAASLGLMAAVTYTLAKAAIVDLLTLVLVLLGIIVVFRFKVNSAWLVLAGGIVGLVVQLVT